MGVIEAGVLPTGANVEKTTMKAMTMKNTLTSTLLHILFCCIAIPCILAVAMFDVICETECSDQECSE